MHELLTALAGLGVGFVVGLTGMGGGALMTPMLVLLFGVDPLAAVSSDLVASLVMKPVGGAVHLRRGTVHRGLVGWLCLGSVPAAFVGAGVLDAMGDGEGLQDRIGTMIGIALLLATVGMAAKTAMGARRPVAAVDLRQLPAKPVPTVLVGIIGGLIVGLTSVGSGSLMLVLLLVLYPSLTASQMVGTDMVQSVPLVAAAALGHLLFGHVEMGLTGALILGSVPGVYLGSRLSAGAPESVIRPALMLVLSLSGLKLLGLGTAALGWVALGLLATGGLVVVTWQRWLQPRLATAAADGSGVAEERGRVAEVTEQRRLDLRRGLGR